MNSGMYSGMASSMPSGFNSGASAFNSGASSHGKGANSSSNRSLPSGEAAEKAEVPKPVEQTIDTGLTARITREGKLEVLFCHTYKFIYAVAIATQREAQYTKTYKLCGKSYLYRKGRQVHETTIEEVENIARL